ncbi:unnamed protein product [Trifolium pratense]|uniref:Uncharacterized protein n=1 Tax=Trifolium pratense TaxID=57577 RepID=A0ACB0KYS9_TRIPR|nr:unnamed protein product [Trifolium pratense]
MQELCCFYWLVHFNVGLLGIAIILSYIQVFFLVLLLPFWYIYSRLQFFYRSTSRELRRLDSVSRSPIYTSFTKTLDGSSTIRAFKSEVNVFVFYRNNHNCIFFFVCVRARVRACVINSYESTSRVYESSLRPFASLSRLSSLTTLLVHTSFI